jgi:hypothetical protein
LKEQLMAKHQTVQHALSSNEIFEIGAMLQQAFPRNLDAEKVRADLKNKSALSRALGKFFAERYAAQPAFAGTASWIDFYRRIFGKEIDLLDLHISAKPTYDCWPIVIVPGLITNNDAFDACIKMLGAAWRYTDDLNTVIDVVNRPKTSYVVWVKATVEADPDFASVSAESIKERRLNTLTLLERLVLELMHFDETKQHLDVENWTLCAGSRYADGSVPCVYWLPAYRGLRVGWCGVRLADADIRARAAVS